MNAIFVSSVLPSSLLHVNIPSINLVSKHTHREMIVIVIVIVKVTVIVIMMVMVILNVVVIVIVIMIMFICSTSISLFRLPKYNLMKLNNSIFQTLTSVRC